MEGSGCCQTMVVKRDLGHAERSSALEVGKSNGGILLANSRRGAPSRNLGRMRPPVKVSSRVSDAPAELANGIRRFHLRTLVQQYNPFASQVACLPACCQDGSKRTGGVEPRPCYDGASVDPTEAGTLRGGSAWTRTQNPRISSQMPIRTPTGQLPRARTASSPRLVGTRNIAIGVGYLEYEASSTSGMSPRSGKGRVERSGGMRLGRSWPTWFEPA
jgi:hypothetical protein